MKLISDYLILTCEFVPAPSTFAVRTLTMYMISSLTTSIRLLLLDGSTPHTFDGFAFSVERFAESLLCLGSYKI